MNDGSPDEMVARLLGRTQFYWDCGLREDALRFLKEAAALAPDDPRVQRALDGIRPAGNGEPANKPPRVHEIKPRKAAEEAMAASSSHRGDLARVFSEAYRRRDWRVAAETARSLTAARPDDPKAWASLAFVLRRLFDFDGAVEAHDRALALVGGDPSYGQARVKTLWEAGWYEQADTAYSDLISTMEDAGDKGHLYADMVMSRAMIRMTTQGPAAGVDDFEWRWRTKEIALPEVTQPYWDGTPQPGKRILFFGEQGFGDAIQFARYAPLIGETCAKVVLPCKPPLKRLMQSLGGNVEVCDEKIKRNAFDVFVPAMSAMRLLGAGERDLPNNVPYLAAAADDVQRLRPQIENHTGLRIGIAWTGSPTNGHDWKRAIPPAAFRPLVETPETAVFSLQKVRDDTPADMKTPPDGVVDISSELADFADTAAAIECLDLVITADTSVAHLAGALGKPVWVLLPKVPDWRWMTDREDSPWYPTMRLYRQKTFDDWPEVMARVAADLAAFQPKEKPKKRGLTRLLPWRR